MLSVRREVVRQPVLVYSKWRKIYMQKKPSDRVKKPFGSLKEEQKTVRIDQEGIKEQIHIFFKES